MPCNHHDVRVASCLKCTAEFNLEQNVLSLGPRESKQFHTMCKLFKASRVPKNIVRVHGRYYHRLHRLADRIEKHVLDATPVSSLPAPARIKTMLSLRRSDPYVALRVHFMSNDLVRAKTSLNMFDIDTLEEGIRKADIAGHKLVDLAGEYAAACVDVQRLVEAGNVFTDAVTCWHTAVIPAYSASAAKKWLALTLPVST